MDFSTVTKNVNSTLKKHSPEILTGIGITGMVTTTIFAVKATPKALMLIEEEKRKKNAELRKLARDDDSVNIQRIEKLTSVEIIKTVWRCYIPAAMLGVTSLACLIGASSVSARRNAALATVYTLSETAIKDYKDKVIETIGEEKEKVVRDAVAKEKLEKDPVTSNDVIITDKGDTLCHNALLGGYFKSDVETIKSGVNEANRQLLQDSYISLNELHDWLGLDHTKIGDYIGWNIEQGMIEVDFSSQLTPDGTPCVVVDFDKMPQYDFDKWL